METSTLLYAPPSAFLDVFCHARGFMASHHAGFDHPRGSRLVLMDYMNGKLLYCQPPPSAPRLSLYRDIIAAYIPAASATVTTAEDLPTDGVKPSGREARLAAANVLAVTAPDTSALFSIPLPKPKSQKTSVMTQRHRARKGEREADPYGTQSTADPLASFVLEEPSLFQAAEGGAGKARAKKHAGGDSSEAGMADALLGKGKGRANATTFTRVQRPYSAK